MKGFAKAVGNGTQACVERMTKRGEGEKGLCERSWEAEGKRTAAGARKESSVGKEEVGFHEEENLTRRI